MARIVFFGTPQFAVPSLEALVQNGHEIAAVVTAPDKPAGRGLQLKHSPVKAFALLHSIPVLQPLKLSDSGFLHSLRILNADLFIVVAFRMLPESAWNMPPAGTYNVHSSLLPSYRGAAPINRAVMDGCTKTGVTTFKLKHEIDTGGIILQQETLIGEDETAGELHDRLMLMGAEILVDTVEMIVAGKSNPVPQEQLATDITTLPVAPKIFSSDCNIHWDDSVDQVHNLVRGLSPFPGAYTHLVQENGAKQMLKVFKTAKCDLPSKLNPGELQVSNGKLYVGTGSGALQILELQLEGKKRMPAADFLRGNNIERSILK